MSIYVPEGKNKPYTVNGHFYLRQGANSQKLNRDEIRSFFQNENLISFEIQTKDFQNKDFSNSAFSKFKKVVNFEKSLSKKHILFNLNLLTNNNLNNAGILFFTKNIKKYFPTAYVSCFLYSDIEQTNIIDSKEFNEDFVSNLENAVKYLVSKLNTAVIIKDELRHKKKLELPYEALREAVINSMIHKDYFVNSNVKIHISPDRVEIVNPGKLLFPKKEFGNSSLHRNAILVDMVHRLDFVEKAGSGIKRIKRLVREEAGKVKFEPNSFFRVIFFRKSEANRTQIGRKSDSKQIKKELEYTPETRRNWIINYLKQNGKIKAKKIEENFKVHRDTAINDLKLLNNIIIRKGAGNNIWYELKKD